MEELDLKELLKYYIRKLPIILIITAISTIAGYIYNEYIQVPMYKGTTTVILVEENNNSNNLDITKDTITINEKLVSTYSEIIKSRRVLEQVQEELNLDKNISDLASQINISSIEETPIIKITVTDTNNKKATTISNKIAEIFKKEITEIYNLENVSIIDKAITENKPYNVNEVKQIIIFTFGGIIFSCILIFIIYYFDSSIKNKKEIEEKLNIAVIGEIPTTTKLIKDKKRIKLKKAPKPKAEEIKVAKKATNKTTTTKKTSASPQRKSPSKKATKTSPSKEKTTKQNSSKKTTKKTTTKKISSKGGE